MAESGGQPGNQNSTLDKRAFANAVRRAAIQNDGKRLRAVVEKLFDEAEAGNVQAANAIADRMDGKPGQQIIHSGDEENPVRVEKIIREVVKP